MKEPLKKNKSGLWILLVAAAVLEATACIQYFYCRSALHAEAELRAKTELRRSELDIEKHTVEMETATKTLALLAERYVDQPDSAYSATRAVVKLISNTTSVAIAYVPDYFRDKGRYYEVCSSRISADSIFTRQIGSASHDYTEMDWFRNGLAIDSCHWSEPYMDDSGSKTWVVSCSHPVRNKAGEVVAVVCVDLALDYLEKVSEYLQLYKGSYFSIRSGTGTDIVASPDTIPGKKYTIFDEEIDATGWKISIIIPEDVIYAELRRVGLVVTLMMLLGLALLVFIIYRSAVSLVKLMELNSAQERMESELGIARAIQMAMLPTRFPPFPDFPNLNAFGSVTPAKEVGGDLFDFYIRENKLYFCIGDVSGKGIPASLVMAMSRSMFRSFSSYIDSAAQIVHQMNEALSGEGNDQNMFVTLFMGIMDLGTGELHYCNAGHNAPMHLLPNRSDVIVERLPVEANLPLGVLSGFEFTEQQTVLPAGDALFLYTDGLTEAENIRHELYGEERMEEVLRSLPPDMDMKQTVEMVRASVHAFAGEAEQSDDLTMFAFRRTCNRYSLVMRNDIQQIPTLSEWIDTIGLPDELNMPINLAIEEAVTNVMLYAYPNAHGKVLVEAEKTENEVRFTISDRGIPFDPTQTPEPDITLPAEERAIGGLGIHLVRQLMNEVHYERKNNTNILTLVKQL